MEFTALLAGEPFSDAPRCVDQELAAVLRGANDKLSDAQRGRLLPFLGRAIGLAVPRPAKEPGRRPLLQRLRHPETAGVRQRAELRRAVSRRFAEAIRYAPSARAEPWSWWAEEVSWLFWDAMTWPTRVRTSEQYVDRLVERLDLLHSCYEQAMADLGLPQAVTVEPAAADRVP